MIIACPACATRYVVPDSAIGIDGRTVRCAKCRHSWHQDGPRGEVAKSPSRPAPTPAPTPVPTPPPPANPPAEETVATDYAAESSGDIARPGFTDTHTPPPEPRLVPSPPPPVEDVSTGDEAEDPDEYAQDRAPSVVEGHREDGYDSPYDDAYDDTSSQFDYEPPFRPRRNPLKVWTAAGAVFALLALGTVFAVSYYGVPDWLPVTKPTFAAAQPDLVLDFPADQQDRRTLPDGSEFFSASGTITNTGRETRKVPSILIVMRNEREVPVYSWVLVPPKSTLAPGESVSINEIATDVPKNAKFAEIGWSPT